MTRDKLRRLGVPPEVLDSAADLWDRELAREAIRLAAATLRETVQDMPGDARAAVHASLMALTPEMAATKAHVTRKTIARAIGKGKIKAVRGSTGLWSLDRDSFEAWRAARMPSFCPACPPLSKP